MMWREPQSAATVASATTRMGATLVSGVVGLMAGGDPEKSRKLPNEPNFVRTGFIFFPGDWFVLGNEAISKGNEGCFCVAVRRNSV